MTTDQSFAPADHGEVVPNTNMPPVDKYAISSTWIKSKDFKKPFDYYLKDSDQTVKIRRLDMGDILNLGVADELDFMSKALITADTPEKKIDSPAKVTDAVNDAVKKAQNFSKMQDMINVVVMSGMIAPKVYAVPLHEKARQEGLIYIDEIPWDDRMELFSAIFETEGLSTFREEQEVGVGNVEHVTSVPLPPDGPVDIRSDDA